MAPRLSDLSSVAAVQAALDEYDQLGKEAFLGKYGFRQASGYLVRNPRTQGLADSKAIVGVAWSFQYPDRGPLRAADFSGGAATVQRALERLGFEVLHEARSPHGDSRDWSEAEVAAAVADYLAMLLAELNGQAVNKSAHRRALLSRLNGRSEAAIEFKHGNISAAMLELGLPYIKGYQPRANFQRDALLREIEAQVAAHARFDAVALEAARREAVELERDDFDAVKEEAPERAQGVSEPSPVYRVRRAFRRDYLEQEAANRSLGRAGEDFVVRYERWRLLRLGAGQLADQVEHVAKTQGDGLGYDVLSFEPDGVQRFIEVKTTSFGKRTPFFVSSNEVQFARDERSRFRLYRVFDFRAEPRLFELSGPIEDHCLLDPHSFRASLL
jgi:predicted component of type VI protein secretion system